MFTLSEEKTSHYIGLPQHFVDAANSISRHVDCLFAALYPEHFVDSPERAWMEMVKCPEQARLTTTEIQNRAFSRPQISTIVSMPQ
jgi:hypothetical protein